MLLTIHQRLEKASNLISRLNLILMTVVFSVVVLMNAWEAAARFLFSASSIYTGEVSIYLASIVYFVGYGILLHADEDVRMGYFIDRMSPRAQDAVGLLGEVCAVLYFSVLVYASVRYIKHAMGLPHDLFPISQGFIAVPVLIGAILCCCLALTRVLGAFLKLRTHI